MRSKDNFVVYYQPQVELETNKIMGAEALVRKIDEEGNLTLPGNFIPYYEQQGTISQVDFFVLEAVCKEIQKWNMRCIWPHISINFSRLTLLQPNILQKILKVCNKYNVDPSSIVIEVTESIETLNAEELHKLVDQFSKAGFGVALDDFGVKYSNLFMLTEMAFQQIKIDRSLIKDLERSRRSQIIMKNIMNMCRELGVLELLAEGIETEEQKERLVYYHCQYGQGYYFYRPMPLEQFDKLLQNQL